MVSPHFIGIFSRPHTVIFPLFFILAAFDAHHFILVVAFVADPPVAFMAAVEVAPPFRHRDEERFIGGVRYDRLCCIRASAYVAKKMKLKPPQRAVHDIFCRKCRIHNIISPSRLSADSPIYLHIFSVYAQFVSKS